MNLKVSIGIFAILLTLQQSGALQCRSCDHVTDPSHCETWTTCGADEMCFTREFMEVDGSQGFKLGCEASEICRLYLDSQSQGSSPAPDPLCFNCCGGEECNQQLCRDAVIVPTVTPAPQVCPQFYMAVNQKCYFFGLWETSWLSARNYCRRTPGSNLVAINERKENDYLNSLLVKLAAPVSAFWLGGFYSPASQDWEWSDLTLLTAYSNWEKNYPIKTNQTTILYVTQPAPLNGRAQKWRTDTIAHKHAFICEVDRLS